jgi:hypothetical protein
MSIRSLSTLNSQLSTLNYCVPNRLWLVGAMNFASCCLSVLMASALAAEPLEEFDGDPSGRKTRYPSPDGRYSLLITYAKEPEVDKIEIIELPTQRVIAVLSDPPVITHRTSDAKLYWSSDSQQVAAYVGGRHGGSTRIFVRDGKDLKEVKLPALPEPPDQPSAEEIKKHPWELRRVITLGNLSFLRWVKDGVVLVASNRFGGTTGTYGWAYELTITIDARRRAKLTNVKKSGGFSTP